MKSPFLLAMVFALSCAGAFSQNAKQAPSGGPVGPVPGPFALPAPQPIAPVLLALPAPNYPIELPRALPPPPPPMKPITARPPAPPMVSLPQSGRPPASEIAASTRGQIYLGFYNDIRDLGMLIENTNALYLSNRAAAMVLTDLHRRNTELLEQNAISREEWERSLLSRDLAIANTALYKATVESLGARRDERSVQMAFLNGDPVNIGRLYALYTKEWEAQCRASKKDVAAAAAQARMAAFEMNTLVRAGEGSTYFDRANAQKDLVAARAELAAKKNLAEGCAKNWPTREQVQLLMKP